MVVADEGNEQSRPRREADGELRHLAAGVGHQCRRPAGKRRPHEVALARSRQPRIGLQLVESEARRRLHRPVTRIVLEEERAGASGGVEGVLVQLRQNIGEPGAPRQLGHQGPGGGLGANPRAWRGLAPLLSGSVAAFVCLGASC